MSKRPTTTAGEPSRLRRRLGWLRDLPIWSKLGLIMIVPMIATLLVGANGVLGHLETSNNADRTRTLAKLSKEVGQLVHELQDERATATLVLSLPSNSPLLPSTVDAYRKAVLAVDQAERSYTLRSSGLSGVPPSFTELLRDIDGQLADLRVLRDKVVARNGVSLTYTAFLYRVVIANLVAVRDGAAQLTGESELSDRMRAAAAISSMKEFVAQERVAVLRAMAEMTDAIPYARAREFINTLSGQDQALQTFSVIATPEERSLFDQKVAGQALRQAESYEGQIESVIAGARPNSLNFTNVEWDMAQRERGNLLREVEVQLDNGLEARATELRDAVVRQVLVEVSLLLGMLLLAILFAWMVARSMARSLRELRQGALAVAQYGLPQAVARLRDPALATQTSPADVAAQIANPLPVRTRDEFGQVTEAFNMVHMEAVRTAAEQASLRASVATMFVNLARRSQILVDRLIAHLDRLERGEEDPDRLAELFQLDHLVTRMRRNDENLLVLAGADSTRVQRNPAVLLDVLRAAQSEVEHYTRIEFGVVDRDIEVAAHAVNDMVHLVAELLENATSFSPPDSIVVVEARRVGDHAVLLVEDRGIGMSAEQFAELNERLAAPPMVDVAVSRMMGLVVVARLASRHGVKVELRPAREGGTIAEVTLPTSLLVPRLIPGRATVGRELPANRQVEAVPPRPAFTAPLALESGPSARPTQPFESALRKFDPRPEDVAGAQPPDGDRSLPAWSDLTGAASLNGRNGTEPNGPRPATVTGAGPLPQRRPGEARPAGPQGYTGSGPAIPRQASAPPADTRPDGCASGRDGAPSSAAPRSAPPFPMSAPPFPMSAPPFPVSAPPGSGQPMSGPPFPVSAPPMSAPPFPVSAPPAAAAPAPPRPGSAPPSWPPVSPEADAQAGSDESESPAPSVPGQFAAALDMTAEMPKVSASAQAPPAAAGVPAPPDPRATRFADETMELPIFRELESAWFRTRRTVPDPAAAAADDSGAETSSQRGDLPTDAPTQQHSATTGSTMISVPRPTGASGPAGPPAATGYDAGAATGGVNAWQTAADEGWRAASAAAEVQAAETTSAGLPRRKPMAQLVPGGVDKATNTTQRRTPEAVRGLLSAYHRGVQRGRTQPKDPQTAEPNPARPQPSQAGKEHEA